MQDPDIQGNVNILLEGYPFLKVFSRNQEYDVFSADNFEIMKSLGNLLFRINFVDGKPVTITPYSGIPGSGIPGSEELSSEVIFSEESYKRHREFINSYINFQLINSGILDVLADVPIRKLKQKSYKRIVDEIGKFLRMEDSPEFDTSICIRINARDRSITFTNYHNDSNLFQIITYNKEKKPYVLGSELLFYYNDSRTNIHRNLLLQRGLPPEFPIDTMGQLIHDKYRLGQTIYKEMRGENSTFTQPYLRFKLNNGDTLVFPDTLWKHAVINPKEKIVDENILHIEIADNSGDMGERATICSERIKTNLDEYTGRQIITMPCVLVDVYLEPARLLEDFTFPIESSLLEIPTINFDKENCKQFLTQIGKGDSCIDIGGEVKIKSRGGVNKKKKRKYTKKNKKIKKINRSKTFKNKNNLSHNPKKFYKSY